MPANNIFSPIVGGSVQTTYVDQMATALPGDLAFNDNSLVDAVIASDSTRYGIPAGRGIVLSYTESAVRPGVDRMIAKLPASADTQIDGIVVRNQQMQSNSNAEPVWFDGRTMNILRTNRVGGRIWVKLQEGSVSSGDEVNVLVGGATPGAFSPAGTVTIPGAKYLGDFDASSGPVAALIEVGLQVEPAEEVIP